MGVVYGNGDLREGEKGVPGKGRTRRGE